MTQVVDCNNKDRRNTTIDFFKCVACILVIINHFHHDGLVGSIEYTISHLGVPLFFMVSGYFLWRGSLSDVENALPKKIKHAAKLTFIHLSIYLSFGLISLAIVKGLSVKILIDFLIGAFSLKAIIKTALFSATLYGGAVVLMGFARRIHFVLRYVQA